jgi:hypothetical protein
MSFLWINYFQIRTVEDMDALTNWYGGERQRLSNVILDNVIIYPDVDPDNFHETSLHFNWDHSAIAGSHDPDVIHNVEALITIVLCLFPSSLRKPRKKC